MVDLVRKTEFFSKHCLQRVDSGWRNIDVVETFFAKLGFRTTKCTRNDGFDSKGRTFFCRPGILQFRDVALKVFFTNIASEI